jgi:hypothetical protein
VTSRTFICEGSFVVTAVVIAVLTEVLEVSSLCRNKTRTASLHVLPDQPFCIIQSLDATRHYSTHNVVKITTIHFTKIVVLLQLHLGFLKATGRATSTTVCTPLYYIHNSKLRLRHTALGSLMGRNKERRVAGRTEGRNN